MPQSHGENQLYGIILNHVHHQCIMARSTLLIMKLISKEPAGENQTIFTNKLTAAISKASDIDAGLRPDTLRKLWQGWSSNEAEAMARSSHYEQPFSALQLAAVSRKLKSLNLLLCAGANPNPGQLNSLHSKVHCTPLSLAFCNFPKGMSCAEKALMTECVRVLLEHGADPNAGEEAPLTCAAAFGHADIVHYLIEHGADISVARSPDEFGMDQRRYPPTPLFASAQLGHLACAKHLLAAKADVNRGRVNAASPGRIIATPLWIAALEGRMDVAALLISYGADVNMPSEIDGMVPIANAYRKGHKGVVRLLLKAGARAGAELVSGMKLDLPDTDYYLVKNPHIESSRVHGLFIFN